MIGHLALQGGLQDPPGQLLEQPAFPGQLQTLAAGPVHEHRDQLRVTRRLRSFEVRTGTIPLAAFVRAALAVELGDFTLVDRLLEEAEARFGPVRPAE
ncbi:DUF6420 family protein [Streptomyces sp. NBC_01174]|nr:DUF6420 family protein [Streptomyces sp. NBC_01174]